MGAQDNTITVPLEVDPTPAVEALKAFLNIVGDVGAQSQKLLSGQMLAPNFASIDAEMMKLNATLAEHVSQVQAAAEADAGIGAAASRTTVAATEAETVSQMTLMDKMRAGRMERRMGIFVAMEAAHAIELLTGSNSSLVRSISQGAQEAFAIKFALDMMGASAISGPAAAVAGLYIAINGALKAEKQNLEDIKSDEEALLRIQVQLGEAPMSRLIETDKQRIDEAKAALDQVKAESTFWGEFWRGFFETNEASNRNAAVAKAKDIAEATLSVEKANKQLEEDQAGQHEYGNKLEAEKLHLKAQQVALDDDELSKIKGQRVEEEARYRARFNEIVETKNLTNEQAHQLLQLNDQEHALQNQILRRKEIAEQSKEMLSQGTSGRMEFVTGERFGPGPSENYYKEEQDKIFQISKYRADGIRDAAQKEDALYEAEKQHITDTESDKQILEAQLYALEVDHQQKLAEIEKRTFEQSWGYAEQLGQILSEVFSRADTSTQKFIQYLQIALQIAKQLSAMSNQSESSSSSSSSSDLGGILNLLSSVASIAALADEGAVVEGPNFVRVGPGVTEAFLPINDLPGLLPSINASVYGTADNSALIARFDRLESAITHMAPPEVHIHSELDIQKFRRATIDNNRNERFRKPT